MKKTNPADSFSDAFAILDQAMSAQPRRELSALAQEAVDSFDALSRGKTALESFARELSAIGSERSVEIASRLIRDLDVQFQETPMLVLGGVALAAFAVGVAASTSLVQRSRM